MSLRRDSRRLALGGLLQLRTHRGLRQRHVDLRPRGSNLGMRIVLASDIHARDDWFPRESVAATVDAINAVDDVDLVALVGDFVGDDVDAIDWSAEEYTRLVAPTVAVLGNHDHWTDARRIERTLEAAQVRVLTNRALQLGPRFVAGIDSCWTRRSSGPGARPDDAFADMPDDADVVVLGHEPLLATMHQHVLHLAGHTHAGQVRAPILGDWSARRHMPRFSEPFPARLYELPVEHGESPPTHRTDREKRWVYTTGGVGFSTLPIRVLCPPEIVVIDA